VSKPETMWAVVTEGNGGYEKLVYREVPVPELSPNEVLIRVLAAGVNNTEINTRLGWYSASVKDGTGSLAGDREGICAAAEEKDGGWNKATPFPLIQGTDCCGEVVSTASRKHEKLLGTRVLVRPCMRTSGWDSLETVWMASDFDGAFAQFVKVPAAEVFPVNCGWTDAELGTIPCAYGTAENMLHRAGVHRGDIVLIPGASGGVGSAAIQLAKRRGAEVIAVTSLEKAERIRAIGADKVISRGADLLETLGENSVHVVIDNVAGAGFGTMLKILRRGGRLATSGAIAGPKVNMDLRDMYLKDITLFGTTAWDRPVFPNLVSYIERGEIRPLVEKVYPLNEIAEAQKEFSRKKHVGKLVLAPPAG